MMGFSIPANFEKNSSSSYTYSYSYFYFFVLYAATRSFGVRPVEVS